MIGRASIGHRSPSSSTAIYARLDLDPVRVMLESNATAMLGQRLIDGPQGESDEALREPPNNIADQMSDLAVKSIDRGIAALGQAGGTRGTHPTLKRASVRAR